MVVMYTENANKSSFSDREYVSILLFTKLLLVRVTAQGAGDPAEVGGERGVSCGDQRDLQLPAAGGGGQDQETQEGRDVQSFLILMTEVQV